MYEAQICDGEDYSRDEFYYLLFPLFHASSAAVDDGSHRRTD